MPADWEKLKSLAECEVRETLRSLPGQVRQAARDIPVVFDTVPGDDLLADGLEPDTLGLFVGGDHNSEDMEPIPPQIILYLENLWMMVVEEGGQEHDFRREVRTTLLHELGHYLGLDEDDLWERGLD